MDHENTAQEVPQIIDPATLCEHCPFAPQNEEGNGQKTAQEKALGLPKKERQNDRQIPLPFDDKSGGESLPENEPENEEPKLPIEIMHRLAMAYLTQGANEPHTAVPFAVDPALMDVPEWKAELEHRQQREGAEQLHHETPLEMPNQEAANGRIQDTKHRRTGEQAGTATSDRQPLTQTPHREAPKDRQAAERERS